MLGRDGHTRLVRSNQARLLPGLALLSLLVSGGVPGCSGGGRSPGSPSAAPSGIDARRAEFLEFAASSEDGGLNVQIARLALGRSIDEASIREKLQQVSDRGSGADFKAVELLRLLFLFGSNPSLDPALVTEIEEALVGFKYWLDEPGTDGMNYWSENHQINYGAAEYLAGQMFPARVFPNDGMTGEEHLEKARVRLLAWFRDRGRFGYSEWLSHNYYDEDAAPLLTLIDFAEDEEVRTGAAIAMDLLVYDMALNSYEGFFGSTHGRSPGIHKKLDATNEATVSMQRILFGQGVFRARNDFSAAALATSGYMPPKVLVDIALDRSTFVNRQRASITLEEGSKYGYSFDNLTSAVFWWGLGAYPHELVAPLTIEMADTYDLFEEKNFAPFAFLAGLPPALISFLAALAAPIAEGALYDRVNIYTYRMAEGLLSSAQDKMKGTFGFQQHAWQATFGPRAVVFTTHPPPDDGEGLLFGADYWTGGSSMPRVGQHENVAVVLYNPTVETMFGGLLADLFPEFTHAYVPRGEFDEVVEAPPWVFARKEGGYLALFSANPAAWTTEGEWVDRELIAPGPQAAWICEIGSERTHGSFEEFVAAISSSSVSVDGLDVVYESPSQGEITFGWDGPLRVRGADVQLDEYPRSDNPFSDTPWDSPRMRVEWSGEVLELDFEKGTRTEGPA